MKPITAVEQAVLDAFIPAFFGPLRKMFETMVDGGESGMELKVYSQMDFSVRWPGLFLLEMRNGDLLLQKCRTTVTIGAVDYLACDIGWELYCNSLTGGCSGRSLEAKDITVLETIDEKIHNHMVAYPEPADISDMVRNHFTEGGNEIIDLPKAGVFFLNESHTTHISKADARKEAAALRAKRKEVGRPLRAAEIEVFLAQYRVSKRNRETFEKAAGRKSSVSRPPKKKHIAK